MGGFASPESADESDARSKAAAYMAKEGHQKRATKKERAARASFIKEQAAIAAEAKDAEANRPGGFGGH